MERDVLVVGESLVDIVNAADGDIKEYAGGSAANVAVALARLGRPVRFATSFAEDDHGRLIAEHLDDAGVTLAADPGAVSRTSTAVATIGVDGAADYEFDLEWRLNPVAEEPHPLVVHTCSLGAVLSPGADDVFTLLERLREFATVSYDVNARPAITGTGPDLVDAVERMAGIAPEGVGRARPRAGRGRPLPRHSRRRGHRVAAGRGPAVPARAGLSPIVTAARCARGVRRTPPRRWRPPPASSNPTSGRRPRRHPGPWWRGCRAGGRRSSGPSARRAR